MALEFNGTNIDDLKINNIDAYDVFFNDESVIDNNYLRDLNLSNSDGIEVTSKLYPFTGNTDWYMQMEFEVPLTAPPASQTLMAVGGFAVFSNYRSVIYTSGGNNLIWRYNSTNTINIVNFFSNYAGQRVTIKASYDAIGLKFFVNGEKILDAPTSAFPTDEGITTFKICCSDNGSGGKTAFFSAKVYSFEINGDKFALNEKSGFTSTSDTGETSVGFTSEPTGATYWNNTVIKKVTDPYRDLYILSGQSNMDGRGFVGALPPELTGVIPNSKVWWNNQWEDLEAGVNANVSSNLRFGPIISLAYQLNLQDPTKTNYFIISSLGGTNIDYWSVGGGGFNQTVNYFKEATKDYNRYRIKCFMWLQGESDGVDESRSLAYEANEQQMILDIRAALNGFTAPFITANIGDVTDGGIPYANNVRQAKINNFGLNKYQRYFDTFDLDLQPDGQHFSTDANITIGERFFNAIKSS